MDTSALFKMEKLPRNLVSLHCGSVGSQRFRLGFSDSHLTTLPPGLTSLTLIGHQRITHQCWFYFPASLRILKLPDHSVHSAFIKLIPHTMVELEIGVLHFTFKEGLALIEEPPKHLEIPKTLAKFLLAKLLPKHLIFVYKRSECDLNDNSAAALPPNLTSLVVMGSKETITDHFVKLLPRSLRSLHMPNQMNFTSRIFSWLPQHLTSLSLDGTGLPIDSLQSLLPPSLTSVNFSSSASQVQARRNNTNAAPK